MKPNSRNSSVVKTRRASGFDVRMPAIAAVWCAVATVAGTGCESLQKKFTRQTPYTPPSPIVSFQDYTQAMTPLDRYRKHYALFDYWNTEILDALQTPAGSTMPGTASGNVNPKRVKLAAQESLQELKTLHGLLQDEPAGRFAPLVDERTAVTHELTGGTLTMSQASAMAKTLEQQGREIKRTWYWRKVEDQLKPTAATAPVAPPATAASSDANRH